MVWSRSRFILFVATAAIVFLRDGTAWGDWERCTGGGASDAQIAACTAVIQSPNESKWNVGVAYYKRGTAYNFRGDFDRAVADFNAVLNLGIPITYGADVLNNRGISYSMKGDAEHALADFNEAIRLDPSHSSAFTNRGNLYYQKGDRDRAIADYSKAISFDPDNADALNSRCMVRAEAGELQGALEDCNASLRLWPNNPEFLDSRGFTFLKLRQLDKAIADYDEVLKQLPQKASSLYGRGSSKLGKGDSDGGTADIAAAKALKASIAEEFANRGVPPAEIKLSGQATAAVATRAANEAAQSPPAPQPGTVIGLFEKHGLIGTFAADCRQPVSAQNPYVVHRPNGDFVQRDNMIGPTERSEASIIDSATERRPNELLVGLTDGSGRVDWIIRMESGQWRLIEASRASGESIVSAGRAVDGARAQTSWFQKCQ
jgi:Flp pilus assembly protein TadD